MPSTYLSLHFHLVFSTKNRQPIIVPEWRGKLQAYFAGTIGGLGGKCAMAGGTDDHVHLLVRLKATHRLSDFVRECKKASSAWVRDEIGVKGFAWQEG